MISLYPSHIPIFSHIHIFHIFLYSYFYRFRLLPCHLCFFSFFIFLWRGGVCFSCGFLVSVWWMVFVPSFVPPLVPSFAPLLVSSFDPFRRFALRLVSPFRFSTRSPFRPSVCFSVWSCRVGGSYGAPFLSVRWERAGVCSFSCLDTVGRCAGVSYR